MALLRALEEEPRTRAMKDCANDAYARRPQAVPLGWISSSAFSVVMSFPPSRRDFVNSLGGEGRTETPGRLTAGFSPVLADPYRFLVDNGLDDPTKV